MKKLVLVVAVIGMYGCMQGAEQLLRRDQQAHFDGEMLSLGGHTFRSENQELTPYRLGLSEYIPFFEGRRSMLREIAPFAAGQVAGTPPIPTDTTNKKILAALENVDQQQQKLHATVDQLAADFAAFQKQQQNPLVVGDASNRNRSMELREALGRYEASREKANAQHRLNAEPGAAGNDAGGGGGGGSSKEFLHKAQADIAGLDCIVKRERGCAEDRLIRTIKKHPGVVGTLGVVGFASMVYVTWSAVRYCLRKAKRLTTAH